ncbi:MAG: hypothetical protein K1X54_13035 [Flavobacteriales bacterium]|nr:hypothetical protein [Flavobacteriales bacterium]
MDQIESSVATSFVVSNKKRSCRITIPRSENGSHQELPLEFDIVVIENNHDLAIGRTHSQEQAIKMMYDFIHGKSLGQLYYSYDFIDIKKRKLRSLQMVINEVYPVMTTIETNRIIEEILAFPELEMQQENRLCKVNYHSNKEHPRWIFYWDGKRIFECNNAFDAINAQIAMRWVFEKAMPSALKADYPEQDFGRLGEYYERGKGQEGVFIISWEEAIKNLKPSAYQEEILRFLQDLLKQGYNKSFMANAHLLTLVLSKSEKKMKLFDQPFISIRFYENKPGYSLKDIHGNLMYFQELHINSDLIEVLNELELAPLSTT